MITALKQTETVFEADTKPIAEVFPEVAAQTVYARIRQHEGRIQFMTVDGDWTRDIHKAKMLPQARDCSYFHAAITDRTPQAGFAKITIKITDRKLKDAEMQRRTFVDDGGLVTGWHDYVMVGCPWHVSGKIHDDHPLVFAHHGVRGEEDKKYVLTGSLWRAVASKFDFIAEQKVDAMVEAHSDMPRLPRWHTADGIARKPMLRTITVAPL